MFMESTKTMKLLPLLQAFLVDPVNLNLKAKIYSLLACFCSIFFIALVTHAFIGADAVAPMIVASMGASAVILFFIPNSPLAQPWPFVGGQLCSAIIGMSCALNIEETASASAMAVGGSILVMLLLRCLHPPGAATALAPVMAGASITSLGYSFVLVPVGINVAIMLVLSIIINRGVMRRKYPNAIARKELEHNQRHEIAQPSHKVGVTVQDLDLALKSTDSFVDVTATQLSHLLNAAELNTFKRIRGEICCADIMIRDVTSVEYGTEVETAWHLIQTEKLKVLPVVDSANRIIGIVTWHDFFKNINLSAYDNLQDKLRNFIRRSPLISTDKPESIGHIMTGSVIALPESTHIAELIPLMSLQGHRQIPIINEEHRLVGMVYQANLVAALYNQKLAQAS
ncbi:MAG: CBS domain-containing membrane protein [Methyloprofundus sp.]|nr:MAG: CBS domain-containing membrane protein [Methyloprofundus sp.]